MISSPYLRKIKVSLGSLGCRLYRNRGIFNNMSALFIATDVFLPATNSFIDLKEIHILIIFQIRTNHLITNEYTFYVQKMLLRFVILKIRQKVFHSKKGNKLQSLSAKSLNQVHLTESLNASYFC